MSEYYIEKLDFTDFNLLIPLMKDCFGMEVEIDYFKWKFLENPAGPFLGFIAVETATNEVASYFGFIPEVYSIDGIEKKFFQAHDLMTHSNHRRKGLFKKVTDACLEYINENHELFVFAFGGNHSTPGFLKWGWKHLFDFKYLFLPKLLCHSSSLSKFNSAEFELITDFNSLQHLISVENRSKIHSVRSVDHMKWRYNNPLNKYIVVGYKKNSQIEGFVCYFLQNNKIYLFDYIFNSEACRKGLLLYLKKEVTKSKLKGIVAFCQSGGQKESELKKSHFIINPFNFGPLHTKTPFIFYAKSELLNLYSDASDWFIESYDHDSL